MFLSKKKIILMSMDFVICMLSFISAYIFLKVTDIFIIADYSIWLSCVFLPICMITGMCISQSYNIIFRYANTMDMIKCSAGVLIGLTAFCLGDMVIGYMYVLVFKFVCGMSAGIMMVGIRFIYYIHCSDKRNKSVTKKRKRTLLIGAGMASTTIINEMRLSQYVPVGIVDDDKQKHHRTIGNVKVVGATEDIEKLCKEMNIETILFAIPSCDNERRSEILQLCADTGCEVKILPYVREIVEKVS